MPPACALTAAYYMKHSLNIDSKLDLQELTYRVSHLG